MKKGVALLFVWLVTLTPSCDTSEETDEFGCGESVNTGLFIEEIELKLGTSQDGQFVEVINPWVYQNHTRVTAAIEVSQQRLVILSEASQGRRFSILSSAYACSPKLPTILSTMSELKISAEDTIHTNGLTFMPGTNINDLFHIVNVSCEANHLCSVDSLITAGHDRSDLRFGDAGSQIHFQLVNPPDSAINTTLRFEIVLSDGKEFNLSIGRLLIE